MKMIVEESDKKGKDIFEDICDDLNIGMFGYDPGYGRSYSYKFKYSKYNKKMTFTFEWTSVFGNGYSMWYDIPLYSNMNVEKEIEIAKQRVLIQVNDWVDNDKYLK